MKRTKRKLLSLVMAFAIICSTIPAAMASNLSGSLDMGDLIKYYYCLQGYHNLTYTYVNQNYHLETCANGCGYSEYARHPSDCDCNPDYSGSYNPGYPNYSYIASISNTALSLNVGGSSSLSVSPVSSSAYYYFDSVTWTSSNPSVVSVYNYGTSATVTGLSAGQAYVTATVTKNNVEDTVACLVTVGYGYGYGGNYDTGHFYISGSSSALEANGGYLLLSAAPYYTSSVTESQLTQLQWSSSDPAVASVYNYAGSSYNSATGSAVYIYGGVAGKATIYAQLPGTNYYATYEVIVGSTADISVTYSLTTGESLILDEESFEDFWDDVTSGYGSLDYVVFGAASGNVGQLTYKPVNAVNASAVSSNRFYADPNYNQYGIDDVTFVPSTVTSTGYRTGTLTVPFTAYGTDSYYGTSTTSYRGTMYIMVTNGEVSDINYKRTGSGLKLVPADFVSVYKSALNVTTSNPTMYIQFVDVPVNGTLYYNYASSYNYGTKLTRSNIGSMRFSSNTTGSYGIDDITYIPGSGKIGDTVTYVAYSAAAGGAPLYVGEIVFGAGTTPVIRYYTPLNKAVDLAAIDFYGSSDLYNSSYVVFGNPTSGTLYKNYANGTGTRVTSTSAFSISNTGNTSMPSISTLTYVPAANYTGVVEIPFTASSIMGNDISGTVKIYVAKTFADVSNGYSWASDYIIRLTAEGVVNGVNATTYAPGAELTYGEALKLIMEATDVSAAQATTGHWAKNYLTKAYSLGLVSSANIDLNAKVSRDDVAEIAAKALGLSKASSITGSVKPVDSANGYVYAMYNAGILNGGTVNGKNYYYGNSPINRAEISKIICLVSDYHDAHN